MSAHRVNLPKIGTHRSQMESGLYCTRKLWYRKDDRAMCQQK